VIAIPDTDSGEPQDIIPRLDTIQACYQQLVDEDPRNQIMGDPKQYYSIYQREQLEILANQVQPKEPLTKLVQNTTGIVGSLRMWILMVNITKWKPII